MRAASILLCLLIAGPGVAPAQTSGEGTSTPDVLCAQETGTAARACNQYCNTLACHRAAADSADSATEKDAPSQECKQARARFKSLTGRDVPCQEMIFCPCTDPRNWANPMAGITWGNFAGGYFNHDYTTCTDDLSQIELEQKLADVHPQRAGVEVAARECRVFDGNRQEPDLALRISASEARACHRVLRRAGGSLCR